MPTAESARRRGPDRRKRVRRRRRLSILRLLALLLIYGLSLGAAALYFAVQTVNRDLPQDLTQLLDYQPSRASVVLSSDGVEIGAFSIENRRIVSLDRMPAHVPEAFVAAEDRRFFKHGGFDPIGIVCAAAKNYRASRTKQGGSTLTQQIIKQTVLADEQSDLKDLGLSDEDRASEVKHQRYLRKIREVVLAVRLERELSKQDILAIYLNHVYLGHGAYGVAAAAETYFAKDVENLTVGEAALLAGLVSSPTAHDPHHDLKAARVRQLYVLDQMVAEKYISKDQRDAALAEPITLVDDTDRNQFAAPYFVEHIRQLATAAYGEYELFRGGLQFHSTLDSRMQAAAEDALRHGLETIDRALGFRGRIGTVATADRASWTAGGAHALAGPNDNAPRLADNLLTEQRYAAMVAELPRTGAGVVVDLGPAKLPLTENDARDVRAWRGKTGEAIAVGDLLPVRLTADRKAATLAQRPALQGAMVVMQPTTGRVLALVGGYDWTTSQFDRATQAKRQVGSSIKPFIYSAGLESGKTAVDHLRDGPFSVQTATGTWTPANYGNQYLGDVTLMTALAFSLNTISVQLAVHVGLDRIIEIMRGYGITSPIPRHISISLGTPDLTLLELATAYAGIASGGKRITARFYDAVTDAKGRVISDGEPPASPQVVSPEVDYVMVNLMKGVVSRGTAHGAAKLGRPVAGKTGTSANYKDVWFNGFTTDLQCSVWIGRDDSTPIGDKITGGGAAVPIWLDFMQKAHPATPVRDFAPPPNVIFARVEPWSGSPASPGPDAVWMPFVRGTLPPAFLGAPAIRSFDELVPAAAVPSVTSP